MRTSGIEILFAEGNEDDSVLSLRALGECGFANKVLHVKDGEEALDFVYGTGSYSQRGVREKLKLILLDLNLPKISGLAVLEQLKSDPSTKSIVVVILTASRGKGDIRQCYDLGANSYVVKPRESDHFLNAIKSLSTYWMQLNPETLEI